MLGQTSNNCEGLAEGSAVLQILTSAAYMRPKVEKQKKTTGECFIPVAANCFD
jgi:hypothetical protein